MSVHIVACACCGLMFEAARKGRITCSDACRVKGSRNGSLKTLHDLANAHGLEVNQILQAKAAELLGLGDLVGKGTMELGDARIKQAFYKLVFDALDSRDASITVGLGEACRG